MSMAKKCPILNHEIIIASYEACSKPTLTQSKYIMSNISCFTSNYTHE